LPFEEKKKKKAERGDLPPSARRGEKKKREKSPLPVLSTGKRIATSSHREGNPGELVDCGVEGKQRTLAVLSVFLAPQLDRQKKGKKGTSGRPWRRKKK